MHEKTNLTTNVSLFGIFWLLLNPIELVYYSNDETQGDRAITKFCFDSKLIFFSSTFARQLDWIPSELYKAIQELHQKEQVWIEK